MDVNVKDMIYFMVMYYLIYMIDIYSNASPAGRTQGRTDKTQGQIWRLFGEGYGSACPKTMAQGTRHNAHQHGT